MKPVSDTEHDDESLPPMPPPKNVGELPDADIVGRSTSDCGDQTFLYFKLEPSANGGRVVDATHRTFGCGVTLAAGSTVTEWIKGKDITELRHLDDEQVLRLMGVRDLPAKKSHCIELILEAAQDAAAQATGTSSARTHVHK